MSLNLERSIILSEYADNPNPKLVDQLTIIHEATDGEIVQYYINRDSSVEGDKNSHAIGIPVYDPQTGRIDHHNYVYYDSLKWGYPKGRITRQRIDTLGVKSFPGIGAIAYYKLAYRSLSQVLAPVNNSTAKTKAPAMEAQVSSDQRSVTFTFTDPPGVQYVAYRVCMVLDFHCLEYITYEKSITVIDLPVTADYLCYAVGYLNEGEVYSYESEVMTISLVGLYPQWPPHSPGNTAGQRRTVNLTLPAGDWNNRQIEVSVVGLRATHQVEIIPPKAVSTATQEAVAAFYQAQLSEVSHTEGTLTLFAVNPPSIDLPVQIILT